MARMKFGAFIAPLHKPGKNPTLLMQHDLELVEHLDRLGYDEVWIGEHHSAGSEITGTPEIFIAAAAERTRRVKLGTGVTSISYHNPLWVADRMVQLDHLTRGRVMLGVGPGSLPTDSSMIGLNPTDTRELLGVNLDIILRLLAGETVSAKTRTHELVEARLQLAPYSDPLFDIAVAAIASPTGARLAGHHGLGLLNVGATLTPDGFDALAHHWNIVEERAAAAGQSVDRSGWRQVCPMHIAETEEQAFRDVAYGIEHWFQYFQKVAAFPQMAVSGGNVKEMIDFINTAGIGVIGTAEQAQAQVQKLVNQSNGGFGSMLLMGHDWADRDATKKSFEIVARDVAPHFQGQYQPTVAAAQLAAAGREGFAQAQLQAIDHMTKKYEAEKAATS